MPLFALLLPWHFALSALPPTVASKRVYSNDLTAGNVLQTLTKSYKMHDYTVFDSTSGDLSFEFTRYTSDPTSTFKLTPSPAVVSLNTMLSSATVTITTANSSSSSSSYASPSKTISVSATSPGNVARTTTTATGRGSLLAAIQRRKSNTSLASPIDTDNTSTLTDDTADSTSDGTNSDAEADSLTSSMASLKAPSSSAVITPAPSGSGNFFHLPSFSDKLPDGWANPWTTHTPTLQATATATSNSVAIIHRTSTFSLDDSKTSAEKALPPKLKTVDLPLGLSKVQLLRVVTSAFGAIAIAEDGSLHYWTRDSKLGCFSEGGPVPGFMGSVIVDIAAGHDHFLALTMDGFLYAWGANQYHQCSPEPVTRIHTPVKVSSKSITACAAGGHSSLCIDAHGVVFTWGRASTSLTVPITSPLIPDAYKAEMEAQAKTASESANMVRPSTLVTHRTIAVDALSHGGEMAQTRTDQRFVSELTSIWLPEDLSFTQASMSPTMTVLVARDGSVWAWGDANATCGSTVDSVSLTPVRVPFPKGTRIVRALAGDVHALALDSTGKLWSWGQRFIGGQLVKGATSAEPTPISFTGSKTFDGSSEEVVVDFGISQDESVALTASSDVFCWKPLEKPEKIQNLGTDNSAVGVSHGTSCPVTYFVLGSGNKAAFGFGAQRASQIYSFDIEDGDEVADDEAGTVTDQSANDSAAE